jgi:hypothetical protein
MPRALPSSPTTTLRLRKRVHALAWLTLLVALVHWAVLQGLPLVMASFDGDAGLDGTTITQPLVTRTIEAPKPPTPPPPAPVQRPAPPLPPRIVESLDSVSNAALAPVDIVQAATNTVAPEPAQPAPQPAAETIADTPAQPPADLPDAGVVRNYALPGSVRLKYDIKGEVKGFPYFANGELLWLHDGKAYEARLEISHFLLGSRVQTSKGQLGVQGLEPVRFGDKVRSEVAAHFERSKGKVSFSANTPDAPLLPGAQDQLSVFVQLSAMLGGEPNRFVPGTDIPFQAVGPRSSEMWVFKVGDLEKLSLPGGEVQAVHLSRAPAGEYDPRVEVWLAPTMAYLPVRIRLTQGNGDFVEQQWRDTQKP